MDEWIAGIDEAGRGCLAGPVFAAAVILPRRHGLKGLDDSKKLGAAEREALVPRIEARALAFAVASASVEEIFTLNILQANLLAMRRAVAALKLLPTLCLVDGNIDPRLDLPTRCVIGGDARHAPIMAASILAKVARDAEMQRLCEAYPGYGFSQHKGYGTPQHLLALRSLGPSPVHRMGFAPCADTVFSRSEMGAGGAGKGCSALTRASRVSGSQPCAQSSFAFEEICSVDAVEVMDDEAMLVGLAA